MAITVGTLASDGAATPHQIALVLPITSAPSDTICTCRYKHASATAYTTGHNLLRVNVAASKTPAAGSVTDVFAWTIIGLEPNSPYNIEVTCSAGGESDVVKTLDHTTRKLPNKAGRPNKTITAGSSSSTIQTAFNGLAAGDVIQFENGSYTLSGIVIDVAGTSGSPIYIRGESRQGVILTDTTGSVLDLQDTGYLIIENLTLVGSSTDSGTDATSTGISFNSASATQVQVTVRQVTIRGVDKGIVASNEIEECLIYDCLLEGNNLWNSSFISGNATWNDDGIRLCGVGNCAFRNTLKGFGDSFAYAMHAGDDTSTDNRAIHYYNNEVRNSGDDFAEGDHAHRNCSFYDNRCHNSMTAFSLDPLYGGPFLYARNIAINVGRSPFKFNDQNTGQFVYNNTILRGQGPSPHDNWGWVQFSNGAQETWGYRNNLLVYRGSGELFAFESTDNNPIDFTHNSWYPNESVWWTNSGGSFANLSTAYASLASTTPVFSGQTQRHEQDNITVSNPWTATLTLGSDYLTEVTTTYTPTISGGDNAKNTGVSISNITDGFSGAAPDRGAIISGRVVPIYGNVHPSWVSDLDVGEWYSIPSTAMSSVEPVPEPAGDAASKVTAWNSFVADTRFSNVYSVANGGHNDYAGNEVDRLELETNTPRWVEKLAPTTSSNVVQDVEYYSDGRPTSRHTYYGVTLNEFDDRIMFIGGARYGNGFALNATDSYNISSNTYNTVSTHPDVSPAGAVGLGHATCADPYTGNIYLVGDFTAARWSISSNTWADPAASGTEPYGFEAMSAFDTNRSRILYIGGENDDNDTYTISSNAFASITLSGANAGDISSVDLGGMVYVPALDAYLVRLSGSGGTVYQVNASSFEVTTFSTTGGTSVPATSNGPMNKFLYIPRLGGVAYVPEYSGNSWFLKTDEAEDFVELLSEEGGGGGGAAAVKAERIISFGGARRVVRFT